MKVSISKLISGTFALFLVGQIPNALALTYGPSGLCPIDGTVASDCNLIITFNADGSVTTSGSGGNYDGTEDALIGVLNNSNNSISSFHISSTTASPPIFYLEGDGINYFTGVTNAAAGLSDPALYTNMGYTPPNPYIDQYGGADAYFTGIAADLMSGTVNFLTPIAAGGGMDYFSLEGSIDIAAPPRITTTVPEPASIALLGLGLAGLGAMQRRKAK